MTISDFKEAPSNTTSFHHTANADDVTNFSSMKQYANLQELARKGKSAKQQGQLLRRWQMALFKFGKNRIYSGRELVKKTLAYALVTTLLGLPWVMVLQFLFPQTILGMDGGFFLTVFVLPLALAATMMIYSTNADNIERRLRRYENE